MPVVEGHSVVAHFAVPFSEERLRAWCERAREALAGEVQLALVFAGARCRRNLGDIVEVVRIFARTPVLAGATAVGLVAGRRELEGEEGFTVALYHFPDSELRVHHLPGETFVDAFGEGRLREHLGDSARDANAWMIFASPESMRSDAWLPAWDAATGGKPTVGGFVSLSPAEPGTVLLKDGTRLSDGAVALSLHGRTELEPLVAQGCRPVGDIWTVTEAEHNIIRQIGNRPILEVLRDTLEGMSRRDQKRARGNIFIGVVHDEYKTSYRAGDFLVRNLAAIDPKSGAVAIATPLRVGQNLQFQIRDAAAASADLEKQLDALSLRLMGRRIYGGCLSVCIGRGASLFGVPDHDAGMIAGVFPDLPLTGVFCNGEFGPVGRHTLLHGYAASLGLFVERGPSP